MLLDMTKIKNDYENSKGWREVSKWAFSILTFGLGGLYLASTTLIIKEGEIGLRRTAQGKMVLLPPGRHSNFPWESYPCHPQSLSQEEIHLGPYTIISVHTGFVAKTFNKGILEVLQAGQHILESANHLFKSFISIKQMTQKLHAVTAYTSDNVGLTLQADVQYQITDPEKAITNIADIERSIIDIAEMTISQVIRSHNLADFTIAMGANDLEKAKGVDNIVNECKEKITKRLTELGITLLNIGITSWTINDAALAHELGQGAVTQSQTASKVAVAKREADILEISAKAKAAATLAQATADADAIRLNGDALHAVAEKLNGVPNGLGFFQADRNVEMLKQAKNATVFLGGSNTPTPVVNVNP